MCKLVLDKGSLGDFTSVSNVFIDEYMPVANGEFVKIYLHLLRLVNGIGEDATDELSTEKIAEKFNLLESDVLRCLQYWSNLGLMSLTFNASREISGIKMEAIVKNRYIIKDIEARQNETLAKVSGEGAAISVPQSTGMVIPTKKKYSSKELARFYANDDFQNLSFLAQTYLGKTLNSSDINSLLYMLNELALSPDFVEYLMESTISSGRKSMGAIERQAIEYVKNNILTREDAKLDLKLKSDIAQSIYKIFGETPKVVVKKEMDFITRWTDTYKFSDEIILEACNRTMEHTHTGSFKYADSILKNWFDKNARSLDLIEKLDEQHSLEMSKALKPKVAPKTKKVKSFDQRTYDYKDLERQLLENQRKKLKAMKAEVNK